MSDSVGKSVWRVRAKDDQPHRAAFDALVLRADQPLSEPMKPLRLTNVDVPFERELPSFTLTVIVRGNDADASLVSECTLFDADGSRRAHLIDGDSNSCANRHVVRTAFPRCVHRAAARR